MSLTVTGPNGDDTLTRTDYINVAALPPPVADFSGTPLSGTAPLSVSFIDTSTGPITGWSWNFGDGGVSSDQNPTHLYTEVGNYTVSLTVTGPNGDDTLTRTGYINVAAPPPPVENCSNSLDDDGDLLVDCDDPDCNTDPSCTSPTSLVYFTFINNTTVPGVGLINDEDIVMLDPSSGQWTLYFDGSRVGVGSTDINALHVREDGSILLSFNNPVTVSDLGLVDDSDVVLFIPSATGAATDGVFETYLDGSEVGLTTNGEDIDGIHELADGTLMVSTTGTLREAGTVGRDEDVLLLAPGTGTWQILFDGSDLGFGAGGSGDLNAISFDETTGGTLYFSTSGTTGVVGTGANEDVSQFDGSFGPSTAGTLSLFLDLNSFGIDASENVDGFSLSR